MLEKAKPTAMLMQTAEKRHVYIDHNATTPLRPEVKSVIIEELDIYGNASSLHNSGRLARMHIEEARQKIENLIGAKSQTVIFTSGGSESNNAVFQTMRQLVLDKADSSKKQKRNEFIVSSIEHPCVLNTAKSLQRQGFKVIFLPVDKYGKLDMEALNNALCENTLLVSIMTANNETGIIQNITEISALVKSVGAWMHTDAVQALEKIPVNVDEMGVDYLTASAHKIYGPKGIGALYVRKGAPFFPLIHGGHQENGMRAGTYNNAGITGFGIAAQIAALEQEKYQKEIASLRIRLAKGLASAIPGIVINSHPTDVLPNTLNVSFPGAEGEAILLSMDMLGIEASTGSACASGSLEPSHVLTAMGLEPELAHSSIRFSLGWGIDAEDIDYIIETLPPVIARLRAMSSLN